MLCILFIVGCQQKGQPATSTSQVVGADSNKQNESQKIQVDKGLIDVEVTLPASLFNNQDLDQVIEKAKADGVKDAKKNPDGSITYKMPKSVHTEMMKKMEKTILDSIADLKSGKDFKSIKDVAHNKSFSEFTLTVDRNAYEKSLDGFATLGLGFSAMYYQLMDGVSNDKLKTVIQIKDEQTNNVFKSIVYPEDLDKLKK